MIRSRSKIVFLMLITCFFSSCEDLLTDIDGGDPRDKLIDTWKVEESSSVKSTSDVYWVDIIKHPTDSGRVIIGNFYNVDADAEAILSKNTLTLPLQDLDGGFTIRGSGEIQGSKANGIIWTYSVDDGSGVLTNVSELFSRLTF